MSAHKAYSHDSHDSHGSPHIPVSTYSWIFVVLLVLLGITVWIAQYNFGAFNVFAAMFIATVKAILVVLYFMQAKRSIRMIKIYATAAGLWLVIGLVLTFADYLTRHPIQ